MYGGEAFDVNEVTMNQDTIMPATQEIIGQRERFYVPLSLDTHYVFCFDEREEAEALAVDGHEFAAEFDLANPEDYIHWAGGALNAAYNLTVVEEAVNPGSVTDSFESRTETVMPALLAARVRIGVHSDMQTEEQAAVAPSGKVGCGYAELRQQISQLIAERGEEIIADAAVLRPELFEELEDDNFAHSVVAAHSRLAERKGFFTSGRRVVLTAAAKGAKVMLVKGNHVADKGILNLVPDTSIRSSEAIRAGLPVYNQDSWAVEEANDRIRHLYPFEKRHQQIAELLDTIGTMRALSVEEIAVRRPEDIAQAA